MNTINQSIDLTNGDTYQETLIQTVYSKDFTDKLTTVYIDKHKTGQFVLVWDDHLMSAQIFEAFGSAMFYLFNHGIITEKEYLETQPKAYYRAKESFTVTGLPNGEKLHIKQGVYYRGVEFYNNFELKLDCLSGCDKKVPLNHFVKSEPQFSIHNFYNNLNKSFSVNADLKKDWQLSFRIGVRVINQNEIPKTILKDLISDLRDEVKRLSPELSECFKSFLAKEKLL